MDARVNIHFGSLRRNHVVSAVIQFESRLFEHAPDLAFILTSAHNPGYFVNVGRLRRFWLYLKVLNRRLVFVGLEEGPAIAVRLMDLAKCVLLADLASASHQAALKTAWKHIGQSEHLLDLIYCSHVPDYSDGFGRDAAFSILGLFSHFLNKRSDDDDVDMYWCMLYGCPYQRVPIQRDMDAPYTS